MGLRNLNQNHFIGLDYVISKTYKTSIYLKLFKHHIIMITEYRFWKKHSISWWKRQRLSEEREIRIIASVNKTRH